MSAAPKLRFPEFDGDWKESIGTEIAEKITKGSSPRWQGFDYQDEGILFVTSENVRDGYLDISKPKFLPEAFMKRASGAKLKKNDILINIVGASIGRSCVYSNENIATVNQAVAIFRVNKKNNYQFIAYCYQNGDAQKTVQSVQSESARPNISLTDLRNLSFVVPSLPEQQKIASFLSSVDKKIDLLRQKKDALEIYKNGLMQKIFSQEIRFRQDDGSDFPDWEEVALGDVAKVTTGTGNREDSQEAGQYIFFDRSTDMRWSDKFEFDQEAIIVAGEGKSFPPRYFVGKFGLHQRAYAIYDFKEAIAKFLFYMVYLRRNFFLKMSVGSTMPSLRMNAFTEFPISLPCLSEQQKIASFLSTIDTKIQNTSSQIEQMETFKKGLLQQMFV